MHRSTQPPFRRNSHLETIVLPAKLYGQELIFLLRANFNLSAEELSGLESRIAVAHLQLGETEAAIAFCENGLATECKENSSSVRVATITMLLGDIYKQSNNHVFVSRPKELYEAALSMFQLEHANPNLIESAQVKLAFIARETGEIDEAAHLYSLILNGKDPLLAENADIQIGLADLYRDHFPNKWMLAEELYLAAIKKAETDLGNYHPAVAMRVDQLAALLAKQPSRIAEAEPLLKRALQIRRDQLPHEDYRAIDSMLNLTQYWLHVGKNDAANKLLEDLVNTDFMTGEIEESNFQKLKD